MIKKIFLYIILFFTFLNVKAQDYQVSARMGNNKIEIGAQTKILLKADIKKGQIIQFPALLDTLSKHIEVVEIGKIDTNFTKGNDRLLLLQEITVTSFDSGRYVIKPFVFLADNKDSLKTNELVLNVNTLKVDTTEASIKDVFDVYDTPLTFAEFIHEYKYWLLGGFVLIAALVLLFLYLKYWRKKEEEVVVKKPKKVIPPHVIAFEKLEKLKEEKLWQNGRVKKYYTDLTDILREYIESRYKISTGEQTSSEILSACQDLKLDDDRLVELRKIFNLADLAKFAKSEPLPDENDLAFSKSQNFVQQTKETIAVSENVKTNTEKTE